MNGPTIIRLAAILFLLSTSAGCTKPPEKVDRSEWPRPMSDLLAEYDRILDSIETIQFDSIANDKYLWRIRGATESINSFIIDQQLESATRNHPMYFELISILPSDWELPSDAISIHASPGYGTQHIEGANLILLVHVPEKQVAFVLYEWIF